MGLFLELDVNMKEISIYFKKLSKRIIVIKKNGNYLNLKNIEKNFEKIVEENTNIKR